MYNFFIVRITNRLDGTFGNSVKAYEAEADALSQSPLLTQGSNIDGWLYLQVSGIGYHYEM